MKKLLVLLVLLCPSLHADPLKMFDILGLAKQPLVMIAEELPPQTVLGVLAGTFGPVIQPLETVINLSNGKVIGYRAHLANGVCIRNGVCAGGEITYTSYKALRKRARDFHDLNLRHPGLQCWISPFLEHDEKRKEVVNKWIKIIKEETPECTVVVSAFTGYVPPGEKAEKHGSNVSGYSISTDGVSFFDVDNANYCDKAVKLCGAWINRFNLRTTGEKTFTPPMKRKWQVTRDNMIQVRRLLQRQEPKPDTPGCAEIKRPNLYKSNSEDYGVNADGRGDRPLLIVQQKLLNGFKLMSLKGPQIGCAKYYGPFDGGGYRYYVGNCSGDSGVTLMNKADSEWLRAVNGNRCFLINSIRRKGYYR